MVGMENISYQSLPPLNRALLFQSLIVKGTKASEIARSIGKSLAYVSNSLRLLRLPPIVQDGLMSRTISEGHARALVSLTNPDHIVSIYREIIISNANVRQTEMLVRKMVERNGQI